MAKAKKTIEVQSLKEWANKMLALPEDNMSEDEKKGICSMIERVLFDTNNYHGYNNVDWVNGGSKRWFEDGQPDFPKKDEYIGRNWSRMYY